MGGTAGRRLIARINEPFGRMEDAEFIATMPQLLDALIAALEGEIGRSGFLQGWVDHFRERLEKKGTAR